MPYTEIDHNGPEHYSVEEFRREIEPLLSILFDLLHDRRPLNIGAQWTIPMGMSCGFEVRLIIQMNNFGDCEVNTDD